ncbi:hypothetical protein BDZ94DRAFT_382725 [Collybia nuda]|uniref:F-box domain-containing protein n=1 Tax=Collybia nuda TaxID=64659 RepID=A0A9P6CRB5_9AGAR|nr:hypothetical protein BDZ94DRAFT_382725 [Collybia nuda]
MPLSVLPNEIISEIFNVFKPPEESPLQTDPAEYPLLFGQICSKWRTISHSIPGLWTGIRLTLNQCTMKHDGMTHIQGWVSRARGNPLSVTISSRPMSTSVKEANEFVRNISTVLTNVRHLCLVLPLQHFEALNLIPEVAFRDLETFKIYMFLHQPGVETLSEARPRGLPVPLGLAHNLHSIQLISSFSMSSGLHRGVVMHGLVETMPWHQLRRLRLTESTIDQALVCNIFRQCTCLEECVLEISDWAIPPRLNLDFVVVPTSLPYLHVLKWHFPQLPLALIKSLTLPALDYLEIRVRQGDPTPAMYMVLLTLQSRSLLSLTTLVLSSVIFGPGQLVSALNNLLALRNLHLTRCYFFSSPTITFCLTHNTERNDTPFLPNLRSLLVSDPAISASMNDNQTLDMLESRWSAPGSVDPPIGIARLQKVSIDEYLDDDADGLITLDPQPSEKSFARSEALIRAGMDLSFPRMQRNSWRYGIQWEDDSDGSNED